MNKLIGVAISCGMFLASSSLCNAQNSSAKAAPAQPASETTVKPISTDSAKSTAAAHSKTSSSPSATSSGVSKANTPKNVTSTSHSKSVAATSSQSAATSAQQKTSAHKEALSQSATASHPTAASHPIAASQVPAQAPGKSIAKHTATTSAKKTGSHPSSTTAGACPATVSKTGAPIWLDLKSARIAAKIKNKPIFADFYTDWCGWCKVMDEKTFHDKQVENYLAKNFVCTRLNAEDDSSGTELAQRYAVSGYPTFMVFDAHGKALDQFSGFHEPKDLLKTLGEILAVVTTMSGK